MDDYEYAGFWMRFLATMIDSILILIITIPVLTAMYGDAYWTSEQMYFGIGDILINYLFPAVAVIVFWVYRSATPGKMALKLKIVDANSGEKPSVMQFVGRYFAYFVSMLPLCLGYFWIGFDEKKQGWHDKLTKTVVIKSNKKIPVTFEG